MRDWVPNWKKNSWRKKGGEAVKNVQLWKELDELAKLHKISWKWVKGHAGHEYNERAGELARRGVQQIKNGG
jgi:ribonuclease HI